MFQRAFIALTRLIANTFFRRIDVVGLENVPAEGPLIFAGNHPNALMDGFLLNARCGPVDAGPLRMARTIEAMMELYIVPHIQGRDTGWEFYFRRTNYWMCNQYTGSEEVDGDLSDSDMDNLADMPQTQSKPKPCP
jgi:hypothetical protein